MKQSTARLLRKQHFASRTRNDIYCRLPRRLRRLAMTYTVNRYAPLRFARDLSLSKVVGLGECLNPLSNEYGFAFVSSFVCGAKWKRFDFKVDTFPLTSTNVSTTIVETFPLASTNVSTFKCIRFHLCVFRQCPLAKRHFPYIMKKCAQGGLFLPCIRD